jgi:hypothetical protein
MKFNKTDDELKHMSDDELFEYLDAKAAHLKKHTSPLSSYKTKKFASIGAAISNTEFDYDSVKQIAKENEQKGYEKFIKDKNKNNELRKF